MKTNTAGLTLIELFEGFVPNAYRDKLGYNLNGNAIYDVWTIGYGHTTAAGPPSVYSGQVVTKDEANNILSADLAAVEKEVYDAVDVSLNENQFSALVSFTFNLGIGNLKSSSLLRRLNSGDYNIGNEFGKWTLAQGVHLEGLVRRREAEKVLWETPVSSGSTATSTPEVPSVPANPEVPKQTFLDWIFWLIERIFGVKIESNS